MKQPKLNMGLLLVPRPVLKSTSSPELANRELEMVDFM
jgi:hypothetical protein